MADPQKSSGNSYSHIQVRENGRAILGNVYVTNVTKKENPLAHLPCAAQVSFNSSGKDHETECLPGTRTGVLRQIEEWVYGPSDSQASVFWLNGLAGTGKSTIARTIARTCHNKKQLGASFFFSRDAINTSKATKFFTTITVQLANTFPSLELAITRVVEENKNVANETLRDQWNQLILQPLLSLDLETNSVSVPLVLVIDALDECESDQSIVEILQLFAEAKPDRLRILITSRPEIPIFRGFRAMPKGVHKNLALGDVPRAIVDEDMSLFFRDRFKNIVLGFDHLTTDWPGEDALKLLVQKAAGLFIYAATVCRFIQRNELSSPKQLLAIFIPEEQNKFSRTRTRGLPSTSLTEELDILYTKVLEQSMKSIKTTQDEEEHLLDFKLVIGSLVLLFKPLSTVSLAGLLDFDLETIQVRLRRLRSVLHVPDEPDLPIHLLHPSFREFLTSKERCLNPKFWIDQTMAHQLLTNRCLERLTCGDMGLKKDICNLTAPGAFAEDIDPALVARRR